MLLAQNVGIDAFALNIAFGDPNTRNSLATAFDAAQSMKARTIQLFLNFDYAAWGAWDIESAVNLINQYKTSGIYFIYQGKPVVSTFEGTSNINDWPTIKSKTNCFFIPNWSSLGPFNAASHSSVIDGLASWNAWPDGPSNMTTDPDKAYLTALGSKPYMMPISPYFYTNLPQYNKNWLWRSEILWHDRWLQAISLSSQKSTTAPTFIQIISWNDYGESHYIGPIRPSGIPQGAQWYVDADTTPHATWLDLLPHYIHAYKQAATSKSKFKPQFTTDEHGTILPLPLLSYLPSSNIKETLTYSHKPSLITSSSSNEDQSRRGGGTTGNNPAYQTPYPPSSLSPDTIDITILLTSAPAEVQISFSNGNETDSTNGFRKVVENTGISAFTVPITEGGASAGASVGARKGGNGLDIKILVTRDGQRVMETTTTTAGQGRQKVNMGEEVDEDGVERICWNVGVWSLQGDKVV